jgi:membrane protease YdiL (CAAX protease family)
VISLIARRPITFSVVAVLTPLVGIGIVHKSLAALGVPDLTNRLIVEAVFCGYVIALLSSLHWWREAGFTLPASMRPLAAYLPLALLPLIVLAGNGLKAAGAGRVVGFALFTLMVGFAEEGLVRGIVLRALWPLGVMRAALLSSLVFGAAHLENLWRGASPSATIVQVVFSTLLGFGVAGARVYAGTIWPAIALHALLDFFDVAGRGFALPQAQAMTISRAIVPIALTGLCAVYGWWLLRRAVRSTIR